MRRLLFLLLFASCSLPKFPYSESHLADITTYQVVINRQTPEGIVVDDRRYELDLVELDAQTDQAETCLASLPEPTQKEAEAMKCLHTPLRRDVERGWIEVLVAPDWYTSVCSGQQLFPCGIDESVCAEKGVPFSAFCPCSCRATVQDNRTIIVTPNLLLYKAELVRLVTGCNNVWRGPLKECAAT